jgi:hypothetical protein
MAVRDRDQFTGHLLESSKNPVFIEFLQQLFPWVICNPYGPSPGKRCAGIEWAINEISQFLYAAQNYSEGSVRLVRSSPDRPRGSFSNLLHGQNTTVRLRVKLQYFILEAFHFARPDKLIAQQEWRQDDTTSHTNGVFIGCLVLWHTDSHKKPAALSGESGYSETLVYLRLDSPDNQGHLPGIDRDVDIFIKVERGDDIPYLYSSQASSGKSESMASLISDSCSDASDDPLLRVSAMSEPSKIAAASDRSSSCDSDSTLRYDPSEEKELVFHDPLVRLNAMSAPSKLAAASASDSASLAESDSTLRYESSPDEEGVRHCDNHRLHNSLKRVLPSCDPEFMDNVQDGEGASIDDKTVCANASKAAAEAAGEIAIERLQRDFGVGSIGGEVGRSAKRPKSIDMPWARINPLLSSRINLKAEMQSEKGLWQENAPDGCINVSTDGKFFKNTHSMGTTLQVAPMFMIFFFHYLFTDYIIRADHVTQNCHIVPLIVSANDDVLAGEGRTTLLLLPARTIRNETIQNQRSVIRIIWFCQQFFNVPAKQRPVEGHCLQFYAAPHHHNNVLHTYTTTTCSGGLFHSSHPCHQGYHDLRISLLLGEASRNLTASGRKIALL